MRSATTRPNSTSPSTRSLNQRSRAFEVAKVSIRPGVLWIRRIASAALVVRVRPATRLPGRGTSRPRPWPLGRSLGLAFPAMARPYVDRRCQETGLADHAVRSGKSAADGSVPQGNQPGAGPGSGAGKLLGVLVAILGRSRKRSGRPGDESGFLSPQSSRAARASRPPARCVGAPRPSRADDPWRVNPGCTIRAALSSRNVRLTVQ